MITNEFCGDKLSMADAVLVPQSSERGIDSGAKLNAKSGGHDLADCKLDLLLVALNSKFSHTNLAVHYLKNACADKTVEIYESNVNEPYDKILRALSKFKPKFLGFSCYIWNIALVKQLSRDLKLLSPDVRIIYGGAECYDVNLKNYCDYLVVGDGEIALQKILNESYADLSDSGAGLLGSDASLSDSDASLSDSDASLVEICSAKSASNPSNCNGNIGNHYHSKVIREPVMSFNAVVDKEYIDSCANKILYYESSRGCPYKCTYCLSSESCGLVLLPLGIVQHNIKLFANSGVKLVKFVDRTFNADRKRAVQILEYINSLNCHTTFHFEIAGDLIDENFLQTVAVSSLGQFQFEIGLQSFNEDTLRAIDRRIDCDKTASAVRELVRIGKAHIHIDLIAGLPEENLSSFMKSFNKAYDLGAHALQLGFLKLLHGCKMRNDSEKYGIVYRDAPPYEILFNDFISFDELTELKGVEQVVEFYHNERHFHFALTLFRTKFDSYYQLFLALSRLVECQKYDSYSLHNKIRILYEFGVSLGFNEIQVENYIRFDFLTLNKDTIIKPPLSNRPLRRGSHGSTFAEQIGKNEFVQEFDFDVPTGQQVNSMYAFDFEQFNVTNGNYNYRRIK